MFVFEKDIEIKRPKDLIDLFSKGDKILSLSENERPIRFAVTESDNKTLKCEVGILQDMPEKFGVLYSIFKFRQRKIENTKEYNIVLLIPTGIGSEIGGHAGDAGPVSKLLGQVCDNLILHPNVVNASDINEMPENALYVEGSVISRLLMGTAGLHPVRSNRILTVIDEHEDEGIANATINAVNAAHATFGAECVRVAKMNPSVNMTASYSESGRAVGEIRNLQRLCEILEEHKGEYDAVALSSIVEVPIRFHIEYFESAGKMVNPWGGVEAMLTHAISDLFNVPSAHAPMFENTDVMNMIPPVVDPRMAGEAISMTFLECVLKGLQRSPKIITDESLFSHPSVISAEDISCMVIPDKCIGLPTIAALQQGITVIAVKENKNLMKNDLSSMPWAPGKFFTVENYWEAAGLISALQAGIDPDSVRRPVKWAKL